MGRARDRRSVQQSGRIPIERRQIGTPVGLPAKIPSALYHDLSSAIARPSQRFDVNAGRRFGCPTQCDEDDAEDGELCGPVTECEPQTVTLAAADGRAPKRGEGSR